MRVIEASPSVGLGSAHYILYGRLLWHHTVWHRGVAELSSLQRY